MLNPIAAFLSGLAIGFCVTYSVLMGRPDVLWVSGPILLVGLVCWVVGAMRRAAREG